VFWNSLYLAALPFHILSAKEGELFSFATTILGATSPG
jgi:hypothetical protein